MKRLMKHLLVLAAACGIALTGSPAVAASWKFNVVNKSQNALAAWLKREPAKLTRIIRTGSYGGYFNFWLCSASVVGLPVQLQPAASQSPSCPAAS